MNKNYVSEKINNLIFFLIVVTASLIPLFFLTTSSEFFEFNKLYFFIVMASILALAWCAKMIAEKRVYTSRTPLDVSLILVMVSLVLSTVTSLDRTSSLFGSYGRWFPSVFGYAALLFFYYIVSTNVDSASKIRKILYLVTISLSIPSVLGLVNYSGVTVPFARLFNQTGFLLSGSSLTLSFMSAVGAVLSLLLVVNVKKIALKAVMAPAFLINLIASAVFGGPLFVVVILSAILLGLTKLPKEVLSKNKMALFPIAGASIAFVMMFFVVPQTKTVLQREYPKEILPSVRESWIVSSTTLRDFPLFGSGVSTFYLNYPRYRTISQNYTPTWNISLDKPANELLNILATMGIFGALTFGLLIAATIKVALKSVKVNDAYKGLSVVVAAGLMTSLVGMLLTYASFQSMFITFLLLGLLAAEATVNTNKAWAKITSLSVESKTRGDEGALIESQLIYKTEVMQYIVALPIVAAAILSLYQVYVQYAPEYFIRKSAIAASRQDVNDAYNYQVKAISSNPKRSQYHRLYANTNLVLAQSLSSKQDLSEEEKTAAQNLLAQSLRNINFAAETLTPLDSANWEARARIYRFLMPIAKDADQFAIQTYNTAIQLNPTSPVLRVELGGIYYSKEDYLSAGNLFKQATNLKSDYANAHYNLGHALMKLKAYNEAKAEFETVQKLVDKDTEDYKLVTTDIENADRELSQVAGAAAENKPTVQAIEATGQTQETSVVPQEPLKKPEEPIIGVPAE